MARAQRHVRHDEIEAGEFVFLEKNTWVAGRGFKNYKYSIWSPRSDWLFDNSPNVTPSDQFDSPTSRISKRLTATANNVTASMYTRVLMPQGCGNADNPTTLYVVTRGSVILPAIMSVTLLQDGVPDILVNGVSVVPAIGDTFQLFPNTIATVYNPSTWVTLKLSVNLLNTADWAEIADVEFVYASELGNA